MAEQDKLFPNPDYHRPLIHAGDYDAPHGGLTPEQQAFLRRRTSRTYWMVGGASMAAYTITHPDRPQRAIEAPVTPGQTMMPATSSSPSASESASPSPSPSLSPSPSKTTEKPSPSPSLSPSHIPSPSATESHIVITPTPTPETTTPTPEACTWETQGHNVIVGECGDHTAYNDEQRNGAHQLPTGMMFGNVCMKGSMVAIHYGRGYDLVDDHGYFPVPGPC